jgi:putative ABC transport system permease protein
MTIDLYQDLRSALRSLRSAPAVTVSALLSLALGIGVNCAVFSVVYATLLRPLPYPEPDRIVLVWERAEDPTARPQFAGLEGGLLPLSVPNFFDYREQATAFSEISNYNLGDATVAPGGGQVPERVWSAGVFAGFFEALGVEPELGRSFTREEERPGENKVVVLSHGLWQRWYGGDPSVVGRTLAYEGEDNVIVGVMPEGFAFPRDVEIWHPAGFAPDIAPRNFNFVYTLARLAPGVSLDAAQAEMDAIAARLAERYPATNEGMGIRLVSLPEFAVRNVERALLVLWAAVGFVLLIACANVASLLLARGVARRGELALRTALGAGRPRLVRQLLAESLVLALGGGALGLGLAWLALRTLVPMAAGQIPRAGEIGLDAAVVGFTVALSLVAGLLFGLTPALRASRTRIALTLQQSERLRAGDGAASQPLRRGLVVVQVALAATLVVCAGLLVRSLDRLLAVEPGFDAGGVLGFEITLPAGQYRERARVVGFFEALEERLGALPGVESVGATSSSASIRG